ncbi:MAG: helix-turn-helix transcriptional regulator [Burkholderiales bacterium]|nr:helix-turn-helix transcriptional regulator [Burkholderiales bacterium]
MDIINSPAGSRGQHPDTADPPAALPGRPASCRLWRCDGAITESPAPGAGHFGDRLVAAMQLRGNYKATALACALDVNEAAISRWKRGGPITLDHAVCLCDALGISMDWLFRGIGQPVAPQRAAAGHRPPQISERTVNEVRALLSFMEHGADIRLALDASAPSSGASAT